MKEAKYKVGDKVIYNEKYGIVSNSNKLIKNAVATVVNNTETWLDIGLKGKTRYTIVFDEENPEAWVLGQLQFVGSTKAVYSAEGRRYMFAIEEELEPFVATGIEALNTMELIRALETDITTLREVEEDIRLTEEKIKQLQNKVIDRKQFLKDHIKRIAGYLK